MPKSLTSRLYLKKQLFELMMDEGMVVKDHINKFHKYVTQLLSVEVKIDEVNQNISLLASLPKFTLLIGKITLTVDEVSTILLENENI